MHPGNEQARTIEASGRFWLIFWDMIRPARVGNLHITVVDIDEDGRRS